jgi:hypothetical protein
LTQDSSSHDRAPVLAISARLKPSTRSILFMFSTPAHEDIGPHQNNITDAMVAAYGAHWQSEWTELDTLRVWPIEDSVHPQDADRFAIATRLKAELTLRGYRAIVSFDDDTPAPPPAQGQ